MRKFLFGAVLTCCLPVPCLAAPGLGAEVYGATVETGVFEFESRYDRLTGGADNGEDVLKLEAAYGLNNRLRIGVLAEFEKEPGLSRRAEEVAIEAIYHLGKAGGIDFAVYGEYAIGLHGPDKLEAKLLMQHKRGPLDVRLNLIAEKPLVSRTPVEFSYAASADVEAFDEFRLGVQAFGDLGTARNLLPRAEHFIGPVAKYEIEGLGPEVGLEVGYLFAVAKAKDDADGQVRVALELEF